MGVDANRGAGDQRDEVLIGRYLQHIGFGRFHDGYLANAISERPTQHLQLDFIANFGVVKPIETAARGHPRMCG